MTREILKERRYSDHPDDAHLSYVLCRYNGQYVTWVKNTYDGGFCYGRYFGDDLDRAEKDFNERGLE